MEVKKVEIKKNYVSMSFIPKGYDDIVMAEIIFGNIIAEQYGEELFEPFPYEKSSFTEKEITRMISSETEFLYDEAKGFSMKTSLDMAAELIQTIPNDSLFKSLDDYNILDHMLWIKCIQPEEELKSEDGWIDVKYQIRVGEHSLESYISEWSTDWDEIRHDLEHLIWHKETEIRLNFEDSPTRIILQKESALESTVELNGGILFNWEPLIKIEVIPNEFVKDIKPFVGYDKQINVINGIYYGLQSLAHAYPEVNNDNSEMTKKNVWNKLHSPMMEGYIETLLKAESRRSRAKSFQLQALNKSDCKKLKVVKTK